MSPDQRWEAVAASTRATILCPAYFKNSKTSAEAGSFFTHCQDGISRSHDSPNAEMLISLTVGKVDAGVAVLLTEDKRLASAHCSTHWTVLKDILQHPWLIRFRSNSRPSSCLLRYLQAPLSTSPFLAILPRRPHHKSLSRLSSHRFSPPTASNPLVPQSSAAAMLPRRPLSWSGTPCRLRRLSCGP